MLEVTKQLRNNINNTAAVQQTFSTFCISDISNNLQPRKSGKKSPQQTRLACRHTISRDLSLYQVVSYPPATTN